MNGLEATTLVTVGAVLVFYLAVLIFIGWRGPVFHPDQQSNISDRVR